jgi:antitoxin VapB
MKTESGKRSRRNSATNRRFLASESDAGIDFSDIPKLGPDFWRRAKLRMPAKQQKAEPCEGSCKLSQGFDRQSNMKTAKLFTIGRNQAVRLPKGCQFAGKEVYVHKLGGVVILIPKDDPWSSLVGSLGHFAEDFTADRNQPPQQNRQRLARFD